MNQIGRYTILKRLGGGGFGEVFLGEDPQIGRQVAIKVFKPKDENLIAFATSSDEEGLEILRARFLNEAKILATLDEEPNIVNVLEYGETEDGAPYYVMPYLPGSLAEELGKDVFDVNALEELPEAQRPRALPLDRSIEVLEQLLTGLAAAHSKGLIHRDIKPSNLMFSESGQIRIVDFGIAKAPDGQHSTVSQLGIGSRNYMAPEQRESAKHVDARADIYSVGVVAYRMLTGKLPVGRFADPNVAVPQLGQAMNDVLLAFLAQVKAERPADAAAALARFQKAKASVGQAGSESDTGTWAGGGEAEVRDELKPLRARIAEVVGEHGRIPPHDREGLLALASIADLGETDLDRLIDEVVKADRTLAAKSRVVATLTQRIQARKGALDARAMESLDAAASAVGWDREKLQALMDELVSELGLGSQHSYADQRARLSNKNQDKASRPLPLRGVVAVLVVVLVLGAGGYGVVQWREGQISDAAAEEAWQLAQDEDTVEAYEDFIEVWPDSRAVRTARERLAALETEAVGATPQPGETFRDCPDCPEMVVIPAGEFTMGSPAGEADRQDNEGPQRQVDIAAFALAKTEVTVAEFRRFVEATGYRTDAERNAGGNEGCFAYQGGTDFGFTPDTSWRNPGFSQGEEHPATCLSWNDAQAYVTWLSEQTGEDYRLPSEAEQEYVLRAGSRTTFPWGGSADGACGHGNVLDRTAIRSTLSNWASIAVGCTDNQVFMAPVGSYRSNAFGLHDVTGNVLEWGADCWNESYRGAPSDGRAWMSGDCGRAVLRGGSWFILDQGLRSANRYGAPRDNRGSTGFRPARSVTL
ncbi:bifunctional serine/threonine-protein kinase/formylglycine-generating enzyme family protein [Wenzhouxiangella marina]|uniref:Serine/threonine-protein kinase pkn1 n=1 Tax=Wenzhouxiangella marina TaxID=1579979 RepID=A0A0K0XUT4_9GAMM|nr:bifunctional serine/threonine-protein kinase/formylglycine-generating enzyme family protein [Wenzhouxiangella marina]AKS41443.1 Serine/threonine-protein kinase pkn1 [Wenzhouxiangella marina]MBB6086802.1 formylglycine-generating enzyme required for sulfatase activity [Wenzhouxiangella marina]